jgi:hypothetical protein
MSTNTCSELAVLLEKSVEDLKSHLGRRMGGNGLAFHRSTLEDISSIFCQQLQAAPVNFLQGRHSFPARKISGWRMELWQAALSYLVLKNSPLGRTNTLIDYNSHLAIFVAANCFNLPTAGLNVDALAKMTESLGRSQTQSFHLTDYASWLKAHLPQASQ